MRKRSLLAGVLTAGAIAAPIALSGGEQVSGLRHATGWLNSPPLTEADLHGKVVLVDFWTYTCINWLRTAPYVRAWATKYRDDGLVVIGVHTPEFEFEKDESNVRSAVKEMGITYPVATDNDYDVWGAFHNQAWPAIYLVDAEGRVRYRHFGEGEYEKIETTIQQLLAEAGRDTTARGFVSVNPAGVEAAADWATLKTPETYLGYERATSFASPRPGAGRTYSLPKQLALNHWALVGDWTMHAQALVLNEAHGRIAYRFHARDVHLVMGPTAKGTAARFRVLIDGKTPLANHGTDVDEQGNGTVIEQRLYQLIRQSGPIVEHVFEIEFLEPGVEAFAFTFG